MRVTFDDQEIEVFGLAPGTEGRILTPWAAEGGYRLRLIVSPGDAEAFEATPLDAQLTVVDLPTGEAYTVRRVDCVAGCACDAEVVPQGPVALRAPSIAPAKFRRRRRAS